MTALFPDVPVIIVVLHFAALTALLGYGAVTQLRRLLVLRQSRPQTRQQRRRLLRTGPFRPPQLFGPDRSYAAKRDSVNG